MNDKTENSVPAVDSDKAAEIAKAEADALKDNPNVVQNVTGTAHHGKDDNSK